MNAPEGFMNGPTEGSGDMDRGDRPRLDAVVVRYERRPDRRTLSPAGERAAGMAWLTADVGAFVGLDEMR